MSFIEKYAQWCDIMDALDALTPNDINIRDILTKTAKTIENELHIIHERN